MLHLLQYITYICVVHKWSCVWSLGKGSQLSLSLGLLEFFPYHLSLPYPPPIIEFIPWCLFSVWFWLRHIHRLIVFSISNTGMSWIQIIKQWTASWCDSSLKPCYEICISLKSQFLVISFPVPIFRWCLKEKILEGNKSAVKILHLLRPVFLMSICFCVSCICAASGFIDSNRSVEAGTS